MMIILLVALTSCSSVVVNNTKEYAAWLNLEENGHHRVKEIGNLRFSMKHVPASFVALKEIEKENEGFQARYDSLLEKHQPSSCFHFTIDFKEGVQGSDLMKAGVQNYQEYDQRMKEMNFHLNRYVKLKFGNKSYEPVLSHLENTYGLTNGRKMILVFDKDIRAIEEDKLSLVFDDQFFNTGLNHFGFQTKALQNIPEIQL